MQSCLYTIEGFRDTKKEARKAASRAVSTIFLLLFFYTMPTHSDIEVYGDGILKGEVGWVDSRLCAFYHTHSACNTGCHTVR